MSVPMTGGRVGIFVLASALAAGAAFGAEPLSLGPLRLTLGGEASASWAPEDRGFFNDTGYERNPLRLLRLRLTAELRAGDHVAALADVRSDDVTAPRAYALYLRVRPWRQHGFDVQAGLVPPTFGAYLRRAYGGADNLLIGEPLAYQYLSTLRADALPSTPDELLRQRGGGWRTHYGTSAEAPGLPLVSGVRWDAGVQAHWRADRVELAAALTQGTLSQPRVRDDNGGKQFSARAALRPLTGLVVGASTAHGDYASDSSSYGYSTVVPSWCCRQRAWGADAEYSAGYGLLRAEAIWSSWRVAAWRAPLEARALTAEGRYKLMPGLYVAARACRVDFSNLRGSAGVLPWDAPVTRLEAGVGYSLRRNLILKAVYQHNARAGGRTRSHDLGAGQVLWWF
jgi:hypothetical protein